MKRRLTTTVATYGLLCVAGGVSFMMPGSLTVPSTAGGAPPDAYDLTGILRDFPRSHADFNASASEGDGHYANNVQKWLPGFQRPVFSPTGYKVDAEWYDSESRPIAPHLAGVLGGSGDQTDTLGIRVSGKIEVKKDCQVDAFNSTRGLYGAAGNFSARAYLSTNSTAKEAIKVDGNSSVYGDTFCGAGGDPGSVIGGGGLITGSKQALDENYEIPDITLPDLVGANEGDKTVLGVETWTGDTDPLNDAGVPARLFDKLVIDEDAELRVVGDLQVICDELVIQKRAKVNLDIDANLTIYVTEDRNVKIDDEVLLNVESMDVNTGVVTINYLGTRDIEVGNKSHVYATFFAPDGDLRIRKESHVYGSFVGTNLKIEDKSAFHTDAASSDSAVYNPAILVREKIKSDKAVWDAFDSTVGPYDGPDDGGTNYGDYALLQTNETGGDKVDLKDSTVGGSVLVGTGGDPGKVIKLDSATVSGSMGTLAQPLPIPVVPPPYIGDLDGDVKWDDEDQDLSTDLVCKNLEIKKSDVLISGNVVWSCKHIKIHDHSTVTLGPGATLTIWVKEHLHVEEQADVNLGGNPQALIIYRAGLGKKGKVEIKKQSSLTAWVQGGKTELKLDDKAEFFGSFMGEKLEAKNNSKVHVDMAYLTNCVDLADIAGTRGNDSSGGITSADTFDEWFRDVLGVNQSRPHTITMTNDGTGVYEYTTNGFHPIDGEMLGNESEAHNHNLTYVLKAEFVYRECEGQWIEFMGGDGAWMYVNGNLAMDLGGVRSGYRQFVELDRLGLRDGETIKMHLFYAQRQSKPGSVEFNLRTNLRLSSENMIPNALTMFD